MVIEPHRFEGVFVSKGKDDSLVTKNMAPGESVYGEKRLVAESEDKEEKRNISEFSERLKHSMEAWLAAGMQTVSFYVAPDHVE